MPRLVVVPRNMGSKASKSLSEVLSNKLGYKVWRVAENRVRGRIAFKMQAGIDKITQLVNFQVNGVACPEFTRDKNVAAEWIRAGDVVMCRTLTRASEGRGIVIAETVDQIVNAPLYTKYFKKKEEYRVHVLDGKVIDIQQKRKRRGVGNDTNGRIRNLANGYVFCRDGIQERAGLNDLAVAAVAALNYKLGAVDVAYNVKRDKLIVLEVNACPGMQGKTLDNYANAIITSLKGT